MKPVQRLLGAIALLILAPAWAIAASPAQESRAFEAFRVDERFTGRVAPPRLVTKQDREYRTALQRAARRSPNFAGHYILTTIGCGASCVLTAVQDAKSGRVAWLPFTLCCWEDKVLEPVDFRIDSDLIVLSGSKNEGKSGTWRVRFIGGKFVPQTQTNGQTTR